MQKIPKPRRMVKPRSGSLSLTVFALIYVYMLAAVSIQCQAVFLNSLPLEPLLSTPDDLLSKAKTPVVQVSSRQDLTVSIRCCLRPPSTYHRTRGVNTSVPPLSGSTYDASGCRHASTCVFFASLLSCILTILCSHTTLPIACTQVVFSRPVIALGSDFGDTELPASLQPFFVECPVPGRPRWVTTNIYRFDPLEDWPPDTDCRLEWNTALKSFDMAPIRLNTSRTVTLSTSNSLSMTLGGIESELADNATDDRWDAYIGLDDDNFPEVPPDSVYASWCCAALPCAALCCAVLRCAALCWHCCRTKNSAPRLPRPLQPPFHPQTQTNPLHPTPPTLQNRHHHSLF